LFTFDDALIPDLSDFSKGELVHKLLKLQLRDLSTFYKDKKDLAANKLSDERDVPSSRRERRRDERAGRRGDRDGGRGRERGGKPKRKNENMTRPVSNPGKKNNPNKPEMQDIIHTATRTSRNRQDFGH